MLKIKNLNYRPEESLNLLWQGLDFQLESGKIYALIGQNGIGKTTLINMLCGVLRPTNGDIYWEDRSVYQSRRTTRDYLKQVGYCIQDSENLFFSKTVKDELSYHHFGDYSKVAKELQLDHLMDRSPFELSKGQQRRLELAIMMLKSPAFLFCDEITAGLDTRSLELVMRVLLLYKRRHPVVIVTHNLAEALRFCDEILFLDSNGIEKKTVSDVLNNPLVIKEKGLLWPEIFDICQILSDSRILPPNTFTRNNQELARILVEVIKENRSEGND